MPEFDMDFHHESHRLVHLLLYSRCFVFAMCHLIRHFCPMLVERFVRHLEVHNACVGRAKEGEVSRGRAIYRQDKTRRDADKNKTRRDETKQEKTR